MTVTKPVRRRPTFHPLAVSTVDKLTDDAVAVTFAVPADLRPVFAFAAGQHLTVRLVRAGEDARRSYSICSTPRELATDGRLRIGVKFIPGGVFSDYVARELRPGDVVEVLPPLGHFTTRLDPARERHYGAVVAGSGITPVLSLVATALATEPLSRFTVLYGNRYARSVMFVEELADLKDRYPTRLHLVHVLSREPGGAPLLSGRLDEQRLAGLTGRLVDASTVDEWFLCGPYGMVLAARARLEGPGTTVHTELFHVGEPPPQPGEEAAPEAADRPRTDVTMVLDGRASTFTMGRDQRVLDAALAVRSELPYSCRGGVCSTCRARLVEGEVRMARNYALEPDELAAGYILTCQSSPVSDRLVVDYDG